MEQLSILSPNLNISDDPLDQISDTSFERMEKICEMMDSEELKEKLPEFDDEQDEAEYIISLDNYFKKHEDDILNFENVVEQLPIIDDSSNSSYFDPEDAVEIHDTLDEVNFILAMGNSTPKQSKMNKFLKPPATDSRLDMRHADTIDMSNVTLRKKKLHISIPHYQNSSMVRSLNLSPSCRTQAAVSHSPMLSPLHY